MNVLTTGIILFSFYTCLCMDGAAGGSDGKDPGDNPPPDSDEWAHLPGEEPRELYTSDDCGCGPHDKTPEGDILVSVDPKNGLNNNHTNCSEFKGKDGKKHRSFQPHLYCFYCAVYYNGEQVWTMTDGDPGAVVELYPIKRSAKTMEIKLRSGGKVIFQKSGKNKPWIRQNPDEDKETD
ncbi:hypothetical protein TpMuguga_02g02070 [Theileria parva strain Muguga]|uniref:uncharacterized protein n=1 Tax=Theileria parva strain Muguga TaxID=333668 RepID=UPI001C620022|nr:uncharacterized protein TpMuguga_02g02070 [Theileria parva strain Muguga]KAF5153707.1 hypothetical protein TpMuguga_02g02070 [Theileria parva strain Muguga]